MWQGCVSHARQLSPPILGSILGSIRLFPVVVSCKKKSVILIIETHFQAVKHSVPSTSRNWTFHRTHSFSPGARLAGSGSLKGGGLPRPLPCTSRLPALIFRVPGRGCGRQRKEMGISVTSCHGQHTAEVPRQVPRHGGERVWVFRVLAFPKAPGTVLVTSQPPVSFCRGLLTLGSAGPSR